MNCPYCGKDDVRVIDSRSSTEGSSIRRRRKCQCCTRRFTTYERVEERPRLVLKKSGKREAFDRAKLMQGLSRACEKRPVSASQIDYIVDSIERLVNDKFDIEVEANVIGEAAIEHLRQIDQVAYVRFASVYRAFADVSEFVSALKNLPAVSASQEDGEVDQGRILNEKNSAGLLADDAQITSGSLGVPIGEGDSASQVD